MSPYRNSSALRGRLSGGADRQRVMGALAGVFLTTSMAITVAGCGAAKDAASDVTNAAKQTSTSVASQAPQTDTNAASSSDGASARGGSQGATSSDAPIGSGGIDLGSGNASPRSYPPEQRSGPGAGDCYAGGSRIYDRAGITCGQAVKVKAAYEQTSAAQTGSEATVMGYQCSHNPKVMVGQGAAPAKCTDGEGTVIFNWRYPGAPLPER